MSRRRTPEYHKRSELTAKEKEARRIRNCDKSNRCFARKKLDEMSSRANEEQRLQDEEDITQRKAARQRNREKRQREEEADHEEDVKDAHADAESARRKALLEAEQATAAKLAQAAVNYVKQTYDGVVRTPGRTRVVEETIHNEIQVHKVKSKVIQEEELSASRKKLKKVQELLSSTELSILVADAPPPYDEGNVRPEGQTEESIDPSFDPTLEDYDSDEHDTSLKSMEGEDEEMRQAAMDNEGATGSTQ